MRAASSFRACFVSVLFCSICIPVVWSSNQSVFVCVLNGSDANDCSGEGSAFACSTIEKALTTLNEDTTSVNINVCGGTYNTTGNINVVLPDIPVTIQKYENDTELAVFNCRNVFPSVFTAQSSLSLNNISVGGCEQGINFQTDQENFLELHSVNVFSCKTGIVFNATQGSFNADGSFFSSSEIAIQVFDAAEFVFGFGAFTTASNASIVFSSASSMLITIEGTSFKNTGGVVFDVNEETQSTIIACEFDAIHAPIILDINGGSWYIEDIAVMYSNTCETAIRYHSAGFPHNSLVMSDFNISTCRNGISFNADASVSLSNGDIDTNYTCIEVGITTGVSFEFLSLQKCFQNSILINYTGNPIDIYISNVIHTYTHAIQVITASETSGIIRHNYFYLGAQALLLTGGQWNISDVSVEGSALNFLSDGGLASFDAGSGLASFVLSDCVFSNGYSAFKGGAIYVENIQSFIVNSCKFYSNGGRIGGAIYVNHFDYLEISDSLFSECYALDYGGAIDIESYNGHSISAYLNNVTFVENSAETGSAVSCCGEESGTDCSVNLVYQTSDSVILEDNENSEAEGEDITCDIIILASGSAGTSENDINSWVYWVILGTMIGLITIGIIISVIVYYAYRKRMSYVTMD